MPRMTDQLVRIAGNGGGFVLDAQPFTTDDLVRIAASAAGKGSHLIFRNVGLRTADDLVRIATNGHGAVIFDFVE